MEEKNIQIDLCRDGGVVAWLSIPVDPEKGLAPLQAIESALNQPGVRDVLSAVTGHSKTAGDERTIHLTLEEIARINDLADEIKEKLDEIRQAAHIVVSEDNTVFPF